MQSRKRSGIIQDTKRQQTFETSDTKILPAIHSTEVKLVFAITA